jgi:hypothetical protein
MNLHYLRTVTLHLLLLTCMTATAHHSNSQFDVLKVEVMTGVVTSWAWSNPHTWLRLSIDDGKGGKTEWALEGRAPGVLSRAGWAPKILKPGDTVTVHYSPAKSGTQVGMIASVTLADGTVLGNRTPRID